MHKLHLISNYTFYYLIHNWEIYFYCPLSIYKYFASVMSLVLLFCCFVVPVLLFGLFISRIQVMYNHIILSRGEVKLWLSEQCDYLKKNIFYKYKILCNITLEEIPSYVLMWIMFKKECSKEPLFWRWYLLFFRMSKGFLKDLINFTFATFKYWL